MNKGSAKAHKEAVHAEEEVDSYWTSSRRPLEILVFLLPFIVFYEVGLLFVLRADRGTITNLAHEWIIQFMGFFNVDMFGLSVPGVAVVLVLLIWHVCTKRHWRVRWSSIGLMLVESILLAIPLLVASRLVQQFIPLMGSEGEIIEALGPYGRITVSIGAGLYEELLFRMLVVFVVHTILVDVCGLSNLIGLTIAVIVSALLFTWYHPVWGPDGTASAGRLLFYMIAGLWFGVLYVVRGFGIVVAVHAFYDIATLLGSD